MVHDLNALFSYKTQIFLLDRKLVNYWSCNSFLILPIINVEGERPVTFLKTAVNLL